MTTREFPKSDIPPEKPRVLVVDDNAMLLRSITFALQDKYNVIHALDGIAAGDLLTQQVFDAVLCDILLPGITGFDILRLVRTYDLGVPVVLMTGLPSDEGEREARELGAFAYLTKPIELDTIRSCIEKATKLCRLVRIKSIALENIEHHPTTATIGDRAGLMVCFGSALDRLRLAFQPIVELKTRKVVAFEVLMRSEESTLPTPDKVLDAAERLDAIEELGRQIRNLAADAIAHIPSAASLFVNIHPHELLDEKLYGGECPLLKHSSRVVLEVTERASLTHVSDIRDKALKLRKNGFRLAIDDLGAGYAGLLCFASLEPEIVKIDMELIRNIHISAVKQRIVRNLVNLCKEMSIQIVAEGIETRDELASVAALGVDMVQGYYIGKPDFVASIKVPSGW